MCDSHNTIPVAVQVPADLSCNGQPRDKVVGIDACISRIVEALAESNIPMRGCCCGHDQGPGDIHLQDGRLLLILDKASADRWLSVSSVQARLAVMAEVLWAA